MLAGPRRACVCCRSRKESYRKRRLGESDSSRRFATAALPVGASPGRRNPFPLRANPIDRVREVRYVFSRMKTTLTVTEAQADFPRLARGKEIVAVQRHGKVCAFVLPRERFEEIMETLEVLADPAAMQAIRDHESGRAKPMPLAEAEKRWR